MISHSAAGDKPPSPGEPEEGGGAAKRQQQRTCEEGMAAKPGKGGTKGVRTSQNKHDEGKGKGDGGRAAKKQRSRVGEGF